ncbi:hypothetical protein KY290_036923 [Solanum tuberosum]|uniref:Integrase catalytic domain-containing protein n=1 Tax=Solanum tuberosum TaxID=4113 RepID=A0ABQ7TVK0_SOLTU|nr:hypothetical protein KY290_036923 [Solanum tuberosum]
MEVTTMFLNSNMSTRRTTIAIDNEATTTPTVIDHHHPMYLQACDTPGNNIISFLLTGPENYAIWSRSMRIGLIMMMTPTRSLNKAYSMVISEVSRRSLGKSVYVGESMDGITLFNNRVTGGNRPAGTNEGGNHPPRYRPAANIAAQGDPQIQHALYAREKEHTCSNNQLNDTDASRNNGIMFTQDQYDQLLKLINKDCPTPEKHVAGILYSFLATHEIAYDKWIVDSGATNHMIHDKHMLNETTIADNILSSKVYLQMDLHSGKVKGIGKMCDGLYKMQLQVKDYQQAMAATATVDSRPIGENTNLKTWHNRLGHAPDKVLMKIPNMNFSTSSSNIKECTICPLARQMRLPFPVKTTRFTYPLEMIHVDVWGPYRVCNHDGSRFFLTLVDDYTRMTWIFLLKLKSDVIVVLKQFIPLIQHQFGATVKVFRSDNGSEFFNSDCDALFNSCGIIHQSSCVYTPQQNGLVERNHKHILEVARAIRLQGHLPLKFWGECVQNVVYVINRLPLSVLNGKSAFELLYRRPPSLQHMRIIGCLCFATVVPGGDKFGPKAIGEVLMGYSATHKGYRLYSLLTNHFFVSRDVHFQESLFPFQLQKFGQLHIFPNGVITTDTSPTAITVPTSFPLDNAESGLISSPEVTPTPTPHNGPIHPLNLEARRSTRTKTQPSWMQDYSFLSKMIALREPSCYVEASLDPEWVLAMDQELQTLKDNGTWSLVDLPPGKTAIGCKWVFIIKYKACGAVERYKARLVAKGYNQNEDLDYVETFSPVVKMVTVRVVLALAAAHNWSLHQLDVYNAFLQGDLQEEVYMHVPQGFSSQGEKQVCRLHKSLYGLKQASRQWNLKLTEALINSGFTQSHFDYSLFTKKVEERVVIILVYVDDILITGNDQELIMEGKQALKLNFKIKDLGEMKYFLGIEIARSKQGILMNQRKFALELITDLGLTGSKPVATPMELNQRLTTAEMDEHIGVNGDDKLEDAGPYRRLVGKLLYLTMTRPDITYSTHTLSQFMHCPKKSHMEAALRVVRYIKNAPGLGILMSSKHSTELTGFYDADWATCPISRRSSAEAEYISMAAGVSKILWLIGLCKELNVKVQLPVILHSDSKSAIQIAANPIFHERTKHIEIDLHFIRDKIHAGVVKTAYVTSQEQEADLFTKALGRGQHDYLVGKLGMLNLFAPPSLRGSIEDEKG